MRKTKDSGGNKLDKTGGIIKGDLIVGGALQVKGKQVLTTGNTHWQTHTENNLNYNDLKSSRNYYCGINCANAPDNLPYVRVFVNGADDSTDIVQIAVPVEYDRLYVRRCLNGDWKPWKKAVIE